MIYDPTGAEIGGGDSLFAIDANRRLVYLRTIPYLNSGPVTAAWAVYSLDAAEKIFYEHRGSVQRWVENVFQQSVGFVPAEADADYLQRGNELILFLQKSSSWKDLIELYPVFRRAHPEHFALFSEQFGAGLLDTRARNAHVLSTFFTNFYNPYRLSAELLLEADLDHIIGTGGR